MNPLMKFVLKILSSPKFDVTEDYKWMRKVRRIFSGKPKEGFRMLDVKIFSEDYTHEIPIRVFHPKRQLHPEPVLFFHGGGWVIGDIETYTNPCINLAVALGRIVYSVDYRLAPEHPYPAGFEDCCRIANVLPGILKLDGAETFSKWILMGDSAGANLAATVSLHLKKEGKELPGRQVLIYPVTHWDHTEDSPFESIRTNGYDYGLTSKKVQDYMEMYVPDEAQRKTPEVSPLMAENFERMPDTLLITAEFDPLRDEGEAYGKALRGAGNRVRIHQAENAVHGFFTYPSGVETLEKAYRVINEFLNEETGKRGQNEPEEMGQT